MERKRYYFVDTNSYPEKCTKANYELWKKDFKVIKFEKHILGWKEKVINGFGATVGYCL